MKTLDVNNYGVQEMNTGEMRENNGGAVGIDDIFWMVVVAAIVSDWSGFKNGFVNGAKAAL